MKEFISYLGLCSCANFKVIEKDIILLLKYFNTEDKDLEKILKEIGETTFYLLSNKMDDFTLIEHGVSIRFGWLTEYGKQLLKEHGKNI